MNLRPKTDRRSFMLFYRASNDLVHGSSRTFYTLQGGSWGCSRAEAEEKYYVRDLDTNECFLLAWDIEQKLNLVPYDPVTKKEIA